MHQLMLLSHGGDCCGIKQIYGFGKDPIDLVYAIKAAKTAKESTDAATARRMMSNVNLPQESATDRLKRYVDYAVKAWPGHLLEVAIVVKNAPHLVYSSQKAWVPILEDMGFKKVNEFKNSNTANTVGVFHLIIKDGKIKDQKS